MRECIRRWWYPIFSLPMIVFKTTVRILGLTRVETIQKWSRAFAIWQGVSKSTVISWDVSDKGCSNFTTQRSKFALGNSMSDFILLLDTHHHKIYRIYPWQLRMLPCHWGGHITSRYRCSVQLLPKEVQFHRGIKTRSQNAYCCIGMRI